MDTFKVLLAEATGTPYVAEVCSECSAELNEAQIELRILNRELLANKYCNQILIRAEDENCLLNQVCQVMVEKANYTVAWVGYPELKDLKSFRPVAWAGAEAGDLSNAEISWGYAVEGRDPAERAVRAGEPVYVRDFPKSTSVFPRRDKSLECGYLSNIALPLKNKTGSIFGALFLYTPEPDVFTASELRFVKGIAENLAFGITVLRACKEHNEKRDALLESETKFRAVFESSRDAISVSCFGRHIYVNPAYQQLFRCTSEDLENRPICDFIADRSLNQVQDIVLRRSQGLEVPSIYEATGLRTDGSEFDMEVQTSTYELGGEVFTVGVIRDITERKNLQQQLQHAQKMEAFGTMAGGMAHDFNNILTAIIGYTTLVELNSSPDDPNRANLAQIQLAAGKAANLTRSLLAFSRKQPIKLVTFDLNNAIANLEKFLRRLIREDIDLVLSLCPEATSVRADAVQIEQVLMNIVVNARDAIQGDGTITVTSEIVELPSPHFHPALDPPRLFALCTLSDTGEGMTPDVAERIFEPFFTTKEVGKGTGLGLAVCYGIIKQHQGYITCFSTPGRGTTFHIYLPLAQADVEEVRAEALYDLSGGVGTILVAEDDLAVRRLMATLLNEFGYSVIEARDGAEAVEKFEANVDEVDLCVLDNVMPRKNGYWAAEEIKRLRPDVPIIFFSGYQPNALCSELNPQDIQFLNKPLAPQDLLKKIRELIERQ